MKNKCQPGFVEKLIRPFHIISYKDKIWNNLQLWVDFEGGSDDPTDPLTHCLKFSVTDYKEGKRDEKFVFKITNIEEALILKKALNKYVKDWKKRIK